MNIPLKLGEAKFTVMHQLRALRTWLSDRQPQPARKWSVEESQVVEAAQQLNLLHLLTPQLGVDDGFKYKGMPFAIFRPIARCVFRVQADAFQALAASLCRVQPDFIVLKGLFFLSSLYKDLLYIMNDVDIVIRIENIKTVREVMSSNGYSQNVVSDAGQLHLVPQDAIDEFESKHYELFPYTRVIEVPDLDPYSEFIRDLWPGHPFVIEDNKIFVAVEFDIHHNLSHGIDVLDIWTNPQSFTVGSTNAIAPNSELLAWFLAARFYHEVMTLGKTSAKLLSDLVVLVGSRQIDFERVMAASDQYTLHPSLFYVFRFLKDFVGCPIPDDVVSRLRAKTQASHIPYHDWGDFLPKLLGETALYDIYM